jgi:hypothetical protein
MCYGLLQQLIILPLLEAMLPWYRSLLGFVLTVVSVIKDV